MIIEYTQQTGPVLTLIGNWQVIDPWWLRLIANTQLPPEPVSQQKEDR